MRLLVLSVVLLLAFGALPAAAQSSSARHPVRLDSPIQIDGRLDEPAWASISPLPLVQHVPTFGAPLSEQAEMRIAYDDDFLYVSARCYDSVPPTMTTFKRDNWDDENDQIAVSIDSYNDFENSLVFVLYPTGARADAAFSNDAREQSDVNVDWNTFWDGAATVLKDGWSAEMRIPWSSLRFQPGRDGRTTMGIVAYRYIARIQELQIFPEVPPDWGFWSFVKPSKGARFVFDGLKAKRPLYVTPYLTSGLGQSYDLNLAETAYVRTDSPNYDAGFDLKYGLTSNMTLDATLNTDFAQVEADDQQVNLTRFSLFFPEKRQFFLERTSNFDFSFGGFDRVFYSRRIGLNEGEQVRLLGGSRLVGRAAGWDVGVLSLQTGRNQDLSSENFSVMRLKRKVFNPNSYVGTIATSRIEIDGRYNAVYGVDGLFNVTADDYVRLAWAQSFETDGMNRLGTLDNGRFVLNWQRARDTGLGYDVGISRAGEAYHPAMGFQLRHDFTQLTGNAGYGWRPPAPSPLSVHSIRAENSFFFRNGDGALETAHINPKYAAGLRSGYLFEVGVTLSYEDLATGFDLSDDASIPAGEHRYGIVAGTVGTPAGRSMRLFMGVEAGTFFDGRIMSLALQPTWNVSSRVNISGFYGYDRVRFPVRNQAFDAHVARLRADLSLSMKLTLSSFVQINSTVNALLANIRLRYNPREGNDFYLVYNEGINTDRFSSDITLPITSSRTVIAKYTYTFLW